MPTPLADATDRRSRSRRKHPRALVDWPVTVISTTGSFEGKAANISRGGALIYLSQELIIGDNVRVAFEVPHYQDVIVAKGEILRVFAAKRDDEQEFSHGVAIQFTELSEDNLKYFTGNIAPEWKENYTDTGPITGEEMSQKASKDFSYVPWILVIVLLVPLSYFIYDTIKRRLDNENLLLGVEEKLTSLEKQFNSLQNSLELFAPLEGRLDDLHGEVSSMRTRLPDVDTMEGISQQLAIQNNEIENLRIQLEQYSQENSANLKNNQIKIQDEQQYYVVQKGDTLFQISSQHNITIEKLKEINGIGPEEAIFPGQKLKLEQSR